MRGNTFILIVALAAGIQKGAAQEGYYIRAKVSKNKLLLGEPVTLTIEAKGPDSSAVRFSDPLLLEHFEVLERPQLTTSEKEGGTEINAVYTITSFDSGHWVIPPFTMGTSRSDSIPMDVVFTTPFDTAQAYHDIKDVVDVKPAKKRNDWWWYAAAGALLLALIAWQLLRKKPAPPPKPVPKHSINPYEEAMQMLEQLAREKPEAKQFHSRLTEIFRLYVFRKKGILSLQKTTGDLVIQVKPLIAAKESFDKLSQTLRLSDFVKFAKYIPTEEDNHNAMTEIKNTITIIEKAAGENQQP